MADPGGERGCAVATERPEHAAGCNVAADAGAEGGQEDDDEEAEGAGARVCGLAVEFGEGERPGVVEEGGQVVDGVENCDDIAEGAEEADNVLREDGSGNVYARAGDFFCEMGHAVATNYS